MSYMYHRNSNGLRNQIRVILCTQALYNNDDCDDDNDDDDDDDDDDIYI